MNTPLARSASAALIASVLLIAVGSTPARAVGTHTVNVQLQIHDPAHDAKASVEAGTIVHPRAEVFADSKSDPVPTGTVTVIFYGSVACTGQFDPPSGAALGPNGAVDLTSQTHQPITPGTIYFRAAYSGDATFDRAQSACVALTVTKATPTVVTTVIDGGTEVVVVEAGHAATLRATATGSAGTVEGPAAIYLYAQSSTCSGGSLTIWPGSLSNGVFEATTTLATVGSYATKSITGEGSKYLETASPCVAFSVKGRPAISAVLTDASSSPTSAYLVGGTLFDRVHVTGSYGVPTGTVRFSFFSNATCLGTPTSQPVANLTDGDAVLVQQTPTATSTASVRARYSGDGSYFPVNSACQPYTVKYPSTVVPTFSLDGHAGTSFPVGSVVDLNVRITSPGTPPAPTGTVDVYPAADDCSSHAAHKLGSVALVDGAAFVDDTSAGVPAVTSYYLRYGGDARYAPSDVCTSVTFVAAGSTSSPTTAPTVQPTNAPTAQPTTGPSVQPTTGPTTRPSTQPAPGSTTNPPSPVTSQPPVSSTSPSQPGGPAASMLPLPGASGSPGMPGATDQPTGSSGISSAGPSGDPSGPAATPGIDGLASVTDPGGDPLLIALVIVLAGLLIGTAGLWLRRRREEPAA